MRSLALLYWLALAAGSFPLARPVCAQDSGRLEVDIERLQTTLETGLRTRRPAEFQFIGRVVMLVSRGRLPLPMVETTFHWARRKHAKYPFPYFAAALQIRAREIGVEL